MGLGWGRRSIILLNNTQIKTDNIHPVPSPHEIDAKQDDLIFIPKISHR